MYEVRCTMYDGGRRSLPMYDVRCTMYDLDYSAPEARAMRSVSEGGGGNHGWLLVRKGRRRLAAPMYDV